MGKYGLEFDIAETPKDLRSLEDFLIKNRGSYFREPYEQWVQEKCMPAIAGDDRRALIWKQAGKVVGDAIIVPRDFNRAALKHFRVAPAGWLIGRGMGDFMMRQVVPEAIDVLQEKTMLLGAADTVTIELDTTAGNPAQGFFERHGFSQIAQAELYMPGQTEVLMERVASLN